MSETLAVEVLPNRNGLTKFFHLVYYSCDITHKVLRKQSLGFGRVTNFQLKNWQNPAVFFAFQAFSLGVRNLFKSRNSLNSFAVMSVGPPFTAGHLFFVCVVW